MLLFREKIVAMLFESDASADELDRGTDRLIRAPNRSQKQEVVLWVELVPGGGPIELRGRVQWATATRFALQFGALGVREANAIVRIAALRRLVDHARRRASSAPQSHLRTSTDQSASTVRYARTPVAESDTRSGSAVHASRS